VKILLINQFFWPDVAATSQLLTDLARVLSERGYEVEVICGSSGYAVADALDEPNAKIHRSPTLPFGRGKAGRIISYASFLSSAGWAGLLTGKPDLVVTLTTPPLVSLLGTLLKLTRGVRHFSWEMDLYPDVVCDLGYFPKTSAAMRLIGFLADFSRRQADGVIALGDCMRRRLIERGIPEEKIFVSENWADGDRIQPLPFPRNNKLNILYSGNLGLGHDIETVSAAMLALRDQPGFQFIFAGGGARRQELESFCQLHRIPGVSFRPYCAKDKLGESLAQGDLGLVTQKPGCSGSMVPSKIYGILAAGRPLLYIGPRNSTAAGLIERFDCGWQIDCGDSESLSHLLKQLAADPQRVAAAGARAREAFMRYYNMATGIARLCSILFQNAPTSEHRPVLGAANSHLVNLPQAADVPLTSLGIPAKER
jgi:colanic acid biosynthesis glycosyl transferase WcaI